MLLAHSPKPRASGAHCSHTHACLQGFHAHPLSSCGRLKPSWTYPISIGVVSHHHCQLSGFCPFWSTVPVSQIHTRQPVSMCVSSCVLIFSFVFFFSCVHLCHVCMHVCAFVYVCMCVCRGLGLMLRVFLINASSCFLEKRSLHQSPHSLIQPV